MAPNWGQIGPKWDKSGIFQIRFSTFWRGAPKCTESDRKNPRFVPFGSDLTHFAANPDSRAFVLQLGREVIDAQQVVVCLLVAGVAGLEWAGSGEMSGTNASLTAVRDRGLLSIVIGGSLCNATTATGIV